MSIQDYIITKVTPYVILSLSNWTNNKGWHAAIVPYKIAILSLTSVVKLYYDPIKVFSLLSEVILTQINWSIMTMK